MSIQKKNFLYSIEELLAIHDIPACFFEDLSSNPIVQNFFETEVPDNFNPESIGISYTKDVVRMYTHQAFVLNYYEKSKITSNIPGEKQDISQIEKNMYIAFLFHLWGYDPNNPNEAIEAGKAAIVKYISEEEWMQNDPEKYRFVKLWVSSFLNLEKIQIYMDMFKNPYIDDFAGFNETEICIIKLFRDAIIFSPVFIMNIIETDNYMDIAYNLFLSLTSIYKAKNFEEAFEIINSFYHNLPSHMPYTDFTKELIGGNAETVDTQSLVIPPKLEMAIKEIYGTLVDQSPDLNHEIVNYRNTHQTINTTDITTIF